MILKTGLLQFIFALLDEVLGPVEGGDGAGTWLVQLTLEQLHLRKMKTRGKERYESFTVWSC